MGSGGERIGLFTESNFNARFESEPPWERGSAGTLSKIVYECTTIIIRTVCKNEGDKEGDVRTSFTRACVQCHRKENISQPNDHLARTKSES